MSKIFICTSSNINGFDKDRKYRTDDNGYYDFGGGLKVNLSKNDNFKEYTPRHISDKNYYFIKDRYATNLMLHIPCVIVDEVDERRVKVCRITNMNEYDIETIKKLYSLNKISDKNLVVIEPYKLDKKTPYWFINSEGKICNRWEEDTKSDILSWRLKSNNYYHSYSECFEARNNILNG